jgi:hypothetical protein
VTRASTPLVGLFLSLLAACSAPGTRPVPGSRALVEAGPQAERILELVAELEPRVIELLGTRWEQPHVLRVGKPRRARAETRLSDRRVTFGEEAFDERLPLDLCHELVHVHSYELGRWKGLPHCLAEGLAWWVAFLATGQADRYAGPSPDPEDLRLALVLSLEEYKELPGEMRVRLDQAASWLASWLIPPPVRTIVIEREP